MHPTDEAARFTTRFRLTRADGRAAVWFGLQEWIGWLIGVGLLSLLCAFWPALGPASGVAAIAFPVAMLLKVLSMFNRAAKTVDQFKDRELVLSVDREGLDFDSGLAQSKTRWPAVRRIVRGPAVWSFYLRGGDAFYLPTAAIPVEARALIARWAAEAGARLT